MRALVLWAAVASIGCDEGRSDACDRDSSELSIIAVVVDSGSKVRAEIDFEVGDRMGVPAPVHVCPDDALRIAGKTTTITEKADRVVYSVTLPADTPRELDFSLQRADADAIEFTLPLPPAFTITAPAEAQDVPRSEDLVLTWEPVVEGGELRLGVEEDVGYGVCVVTESEGHDYKDRRGVDVPDTGSWTIPAGVVGSELTEPCPAYYVLKRTARATYPEALARAAI